MGNGFKQGERNMKNEQSFFSIEVTDTFSGGGGANYCWVRRYKLKARNIQGAISKLSKSGDFVGFRKSYSAGDSARYDLTAACICAFVDYWDDDTHNHYTVKTL
jgi:hypothetical protein